MTRRPVFLLTDFQPTSPYPGILRAVLARLAPEVRVHDLGHGIRPGAVEEGAFVLAAAWSYLPDDAVVVAVVDPGVGSDRRILCAQVEGRSCLAPDNGLLTGVLSRGEEVLLYGVDRPDLELPAPSATFHGRDVFAPLAAHLAQGLDAAELGPAAGDPIRLDGLQPRRERDRIRGRIVLVDAFGNLITNIHREGLPPGVVPGAVCAGARTFSGVQRTYADVAPGTPVVYFGSTGHLEIAVRQRRADVVLGLSAGDGVELRLRGGGR